MYWMYVNFNKKLKNFGFFLYFLLDVGMNGELYVLNCSKVEYLD